MASLRERGEVRLRRLRASSVLLLRPTTTLEVFFRAALHALPKRHLWWHPCILPCGRLSEAQTLAERAHNDRAATLRLIA